MRKITTRSVPRNDEEAAELKKVLAARDERELKIHVKQVSDIVSKIRKGELLTKWQIDFLGIRIFEILKPIKLYDTQTGEPRLFYRLEMPEITRENIWFWDRVEYQRQKSEKEEFQNDPTSLDYWDMSVRAQGVFHDNGIRNQADLCNLTRAELMAFKNCGKKTVEEIIEAIKDHGLTLKGEAEQS